MDKVKEIQYIKRSQKDYSMSFKLQVVQEVERGELSQLAAKRKYGNFDWENQTPSTMPKTHEQHILELEQKVRLLEKQKAFLEAQVDRSDRKAVLFDMMIDIAEKEFNIPIRKKCSPEQSIAAAKKEKKR